MKKKHMIAIAAVAVFAAGATAFAVQAGGKDDPLTPTESTASSDVSLTIGEINSAGTIGGITSAGVGSSAASDTDKNTTTSELTSIAPKSSSAPSAPVIDGAGSETSSGYTKATNPALTDPSKKPSYKETPIIDDGKKSSSSSSPSSKKPSNPSSSSKPSNSSSEPSGKKNPGDIYVPGYGWKQPTGGEGEVLDGKPGTGEQIGIME